MSDPISSLPEMVGASPGSILRRCREFHGITLEEASETTKIGVSYLKALEDDQIREFANRAYLKGFLRIYAAYLGLDSAEVSRMYDKLFGVQSDKPDPACAAPTPPRSPRRLTFLKKLIFPAFLLLVIVLTATFFKRAPSPLVRQAQLPVAAAPPQQNAAVQMVQSSARVREAAKEAPPPLRAEARPAEPADPETAPPPKRPTDEVKGFILKIKVTQGGTLTATVDGSGSQQYELAIGDVIVWKAEKKVTLELSNAGGVDVELNGKPYRSLGPPGKPAYVELDADGVKQ